ALLVPRLASASAMVLMVVMAGAITTRLVHGQLPSGDFVLFALLGVVSFGRWPGILRVRRGWYKGARASALDRLGCRARRLDGAGDFLRRQQLAHLPRHLSAAALGADPRHGADRVVRVGRADAGGGVAGRAISDPARVDRHEPDGARAGGSDSGVRESRVD